MPGIVSDTTPLNYLVLIEAINVLPRLYQRVLIPLAVKAELSVPEAPDLVRARVASAPSWLEILACAKIVDPALARLDAGEREAICLATERRMSLLLMDERDGSAAARARGITVIGTVSVLDAAAARGWLDLPEMFNRLSQTSFRFPRRLMASMLGSTPFVPRNTNRVARRSVSARVRYLLSVCNSECFCRVPHTETLDGMAGPS